jgi:hypothetical protein
VDSPMLRLPRRREKAGDSGTEALLHRSRLLKSPLVQVLPLRARPSTPAAASVAMPHARWGINSARALVVPVLEARSGHPPNE